MQKDALLLVPLALIALGGVAATDPPSRRGGGKSANDQPKSNQPDPGSRAHSAATDSQDSDGNDAAPAEKYVRSGLACEYNIPRCITWLESNAKSQHLRAFLTDDFMDDFHDILGTIEGEEQSVRATRDNKAEDLARARKRRDENTNERQVSYLDRCVRDELTLWNDADALVRKYHNLARDGRLRYADAELLRSSPPADWTPSVGPSTAKTIRITNSTSAPVYVWFVSWSKVGWQDQGWLRIEEHAILEVPVSQWDTFWWSVYGTPIQDLSSDRLLLLVTSGSGAERRTDACVFSRAKFSAGAITVMGPR